MQQKSYFFEWLTATSLVLIAGFIGVVLYTGVWRLPFHRVKETGIARYSVKIKLKTDLSAINGKAARELTLKAADAILQARIEGAGKLVKADYNADNGIITYDISNITDTPGLSWLLTAKGRLEFYPTFEISEIWESIQAVNSAVSLIRYNQTIEDAKSGKGSLSRGDELFGTDKIDTAYNPQKAGNGVKGDDYSLFTLLSPNLKHEGENYELGEGPMIGYAPIKDTAAINGYLQMPEIKKLLPANLKLLWAINPLGYGLDNVGLYAINCPGLTLQAPLNGESLKDAYATYDANGIPEVDVALNIGGSAIFERMTAEASSGSSTKKCIAIVLDGKVYSAPRVQQVITGGRMQITGIDSDEEAKRLANILTSGELKLPVSVVSTSVSKNALGVF